MGCRRFRYVKILSKKVYICKVSQKDIQIIDKTPKNTPDIKQIQSFILVVIMSKILTPEEVRESGAFNLFESSVG